MDHVFNLCEGKFDFLERLSDNLLLNIISYLDLEDLTNLSQTSRRFSKVMVKCFVYIENFPLCFLKVVSFFLFFSIVFILYIYLSKHVLNTYFMTGTVLGMEAAEMCRCYFCPPETHSLIGETHTEADYYNVVESILQGMCVQDTKVVQSAFLCLASPKRAPASGF